MSLSMKKIHAIGATCLLSAALSIPARATGPEVELLCEFRPTQASRMAAETARFHQSNADALREEIADELAERHRSERAEFSSNRVTFRNAPTAH